MPFITEEIWQALGKICNERGFETVEVCSPILMRSSWPQLPESWQQPEIENQFAQFQTAIGAVREIRSAQNLKPKDQIDFSIRCEQKSAALLEPMSIFFESMANAKLTEMGPEIKPPKINATIAKSDMEIYVSLAGLIDVEAETQRLNKEKAKIEKAIAGNENKLNNEKFTANAPDDVVQSVKESLQQYKKQLEQLEESLSELAALS